MRFLGGITRRVTARSAPLGDSRTDGREDGGLRDFARRDVRTGKRERKKQEGREGKRERKCRGGKGREETKKSSRYLERVTRCRVKKIFLSLFSLFLPPLGLFLSNSLFLEERLHSSVPKIWIMHERKRKTLWRLYTPRARRHAEIHESIIRFLIRRCRIWRMRSGIFLGTLFVLFDEGSLLSWGKVSSRIKYEESRVHLYIS